jgi:trehalose 6-phosphate phosphatase
MSQIQLVSIELRAGRVELQILCSYCSLMSQNAVTPSREAWALFLDVDGTLLEIAQTPQSVVVPQALKSLLVELSIRFDGALALVSGRRLSDLDHLFAPLRFCAAGVHGCERRESNGCVVRPAFEREALAAARYELERFTAVHDGLLLEDKGFSIALHFRLAPFLSGEVHREMKRILLRLGPSYSLIGGKCVFEIRPAQFTKGTAIAAFMEAAPFAGRTPIFIGDDLTDEDGFAFVNELGGLSIGVGDACLTHAKHSLANVREVRRWLESIPPPKFETLERWARPDG